MCIRKNKVHRAFIKVRVSLNHMHLLTPYMNVLKHNKKTPQHFGMFRGVHHQDSLISLRVKKMSVMYAFCRL